MPDQVEGLLSPWLREQRIKIVRPYVRGKVLDYGCGVGKIAEICSPDTYLGVDIDDASLKIAGEKYPGFRFEKKSPQNEEFDTILLLAVIEHISDPGPFLKQLKMMLRPNGRIVLTTPHPSARWIHSLGALMGLFSGYANEEHEDLMDYYCIERCSSDVGLIILNYKRFLLGANQLFVMGRK